MALNKSARDRLPPELQDLTPEAFNQWRHHPVTKAFHRWLKDYREMLRQQHVDRWEQGSLLNAQGEEQARVRCEMSQEMVDLKMASIMRPYLEDDEYDADGRLLPPPTDDIQSSKD